MIEMRKGSSDHNLASLSQISPENVFLYRNDPQTSGAEDAGFRIPSRDGRESSLLHRRQHQRRGQA